MQEAKPTLAHLDERSLNSKHLILINAECFSFEQYSVLIAQVRIPDYIVLLCICQDLLIVASVEQEVRVVDANVQSFSRFFAKFSQQQFVFLDFDVVVGYWQISILKIELLLTHPLLVNSKYRINQAPDVAYAEHSLFIASRRQ